MKKQSYITILIVFALSGYFATVYFIDKFDTNLHQNAMQLSSTNQQSLLSAQAFKILNQDGCQYCHIKNSPLPFYANFPIAKQLIRKDIQQGLREFDMSNLMTKMQNNQPVSEADLAKLNAVFEKHSMPTLNFLLIHWRSRLSKNELNVLVDWIHQEHEKYYPISKAAPEFKYESVQPITTVFTVNSEKVNLGKDLFDDKRLSADNTISCASCHNLNTGGVDRQDVSTGINGLKGHINAPTVYNSAFNIKQFWDGRAENLHEQVGGPPLNPVEMGSSSWNEIIQKLNTDATLKTKFNKIYGNGITENNIKDAIAEFEKTLITPNSRFDQYLSGNTNALTQTEKEGYALFKKYQCQTCHVGQSLGGQSFEIMGLRANYFKDRGNIITEDQGRYNVTHDPNDLYRFKVPNLRNIELTPPYFHDAHAKTLEQAVESMAKYQVGVNLSQAEIDKIVSFLKTLSGEYTPQSVTH